MGEKFKRFIQEQSNIEADRIMELVNQDPEMADVHAPDEMGEALFASIAAYEKEKSERKLSAEEKELIELGKVYKKKRKLKKYVAAALVAILAMSFGGITVMGGPEKVIEVVEKWIAGGSETRINSDDERIESESVVSHTEEEAYERIREEFGFDPVVMYYLPEGISFVECEIFEDAQLINVIFKGMKNESITYAIRPNYKVSSTGSDTEDIILESYIKEKEGTTLNIKEHKVEESGQRYFCVEFEHNNAYCFIQMYGLEYKEVKKMVENLHFVNQ